MNGGGGGRRDNFVRIERKNGIRSGGRCEYQDSQDLLHASKTSIRTCANVVPIGVVGGKLLEGAGFDKVDPGGYLELARTLEVGCVCRDEGLRAVRQTHTRSVQRSS